MKKSQGPKKHHFVPECYLKNFLQGGQFFTLDIRKVQKGYKEYPQRSHPGKICYLEDYYKITPGPLNNQFRLNGRDDLYIETDVLRNLEGKYGGLFHRLTTTDTMILSEAINLCDFILQIKLRNPYWLEKTIEKNKDAWIDTGVENTYKKGLTVNPRFQLIPEDIRKLVVDHIKAENKNAADFATKMQQFSLIGRYAEDSERNDKLREAVIDCRWIILTAPPQGPYFITSDNPGFATANDNLIYNTKFTCGFYFYFPLSPSDCLLITDKERDNSYSQKHTLKTIPHINIDPNMVIYINNQEIQLMNKLLIASDNWYLSQIAEINKPK